MITYSRSGRTVRLSALMVLALLSVAVCTEKTDSKNDSELTDFATRYAAAWSSQNPEALASFYAANGSLTVNAGEPSVGRAAIAATAMEFIDAFPNMVVKMDSVGEEGSHAIFHWTWTGTNTGPGGTGNAVRISGYEEWTFGADGLLVESKGHYDEAEYQRQMSRDVGRR
ncbi:MAG: nuclear transport factor 2 family protein [Gemmatimonadota bacterium]